MSEALPDWAPLLRLAARHFADDDEGLARFVDSLPQRVVARLLGEWWWQAHAGQLAPGGDWPVWLLMAGRGFGKTRAGAEWISAQARSQPGARIALVGGSRDEVAKVMVEGPSGLQAVARSGETLQWRPTIGTITFASGAMAFVYSAEAPEALRGPEHHFAWCDELGKWPVAAAGALTGRGEAAWDNLMMGLRLGARPRAVVTTTPRTTPLMRRVRALPGLAQSHGATGDNPHLPGAFVTYVRETYGGTRLGRQELAGEMIEDVAGSLFPRALIEAARVAAGDPARVALRDGPSTDSGPPQDERFARVVVGVDPPATAAGTCGIVVCAADGDGGLHILADASVGGASPERWAAAVAAAAAAWGADRVVAEKNQGGDMVASVLRAADVALPLTLVSASRGKVARAEPIAILFEGGRVRLHGALPRLEDELAGLVVGGGYDGPGASPDRADACVWALSALMRGDRAPRARWL